MVHQILYISSSIDTTDKSVDDIVSKACSHNSVKAISGILLFRAGIFLQLLEGPREDVEALFEKIQKDTRHSNIIVLFRQNCPERVFSDWGMGLRLLSDLDIKMVNEILSWNKLISSASEEGINRDLILHMLEKFKTKDLSRSYV